MFSTCIIQNVIFISFNKSYAFFLWKKKFYHFDGNNSTFYSTFQKCCNFKPKKNGVLLLVPLFNKYVDIKILVAMVLVVRAMISKKLQF
jgi:hypothetical protein